LKKIEGTDFKWRTKMALSLPKRLFSVSEYYKMAEAGILTEEDRVELIEGEIRPMSPIGPRHAGGVKRLTLLLNRIPDFDSIVSVQDPIRLNDLSEPVPDLVLLKYREDIYARSHPTPSEIYLVIEISDTSVGYDREVKAFLYAQSEIPEYWLVNLVDRCILQFSQPAHGEYTLIQIYRDGDTIQSKILPQLSLSVSEILGDSQL
jgi:Uma2 family endonuclease